MDFDIAGSNKIWYPRVKRSAINIDRRYRYAFGLADQWVLDVLRIDHRYDPELLLRPTEYQKLVNGERFFDPEKGVIRIQTGIPHKISFSQPITLLSGVTVKSCTLRIPTWVNSRQLYHWLKSENGPRKKDLLGRMLVAGYDYSSAYQHDPDIDYGFHTRRHLSFSDQHF